MSQPSWIGYELGGRYKIEDMLGQGGMSAVYRATDPNLRRVVAVKMIHPHLSTDPEFVRRFEEEAAAVAQLRHPNIVQVFDFNHDNNVYYMVLEFVPGETLKQRLQRFNEKNRRIPLYDVVQIMARICDAVAYAHQRNLVHRDIKPANIMLNMENEPVLMDFGIARILGGQTHTATGATVGTALYMSPEQAQGRRADERSDIYSLGVTLFEMVSGRPPFEGDSAMSIMMKHVTDPVPDLRELNPDTPPDVEQIILKALDKEPGRRFQSASDMAAALRAADLAAKPSTEATATLPVGAGETYIEPAPPSSSEPTWQGNSARQAALDPHLQPYEAQPGYGAAPPAGPAAPRGRGRSGGRSTGLMVGGVIGGVLLLACVGGAIILATQVLGGGNGDGSGTAVSDNPLGGQPTGESLETTVGGEATSEPTAEEVEPTDAPESTDTPEPSLTPTQAMTPTPTAPPEPYALIRSITLDGVYYVVEYETYGYTESWNGRHVHFFFDTVPPEQAGVPGGGPWKLYGGPRPFREYTTGDRPSGATQMCILVANPDHSVIQETGNCADLPES